VGRICAVCDVYDALLSTRPYKDPWSIQQALEEVKRLSGSMLDPRLVAAFIELAPGLGKELEAIGKQASGRAAVRPAAA